MGRGADPAAAGTYCYRPPWLRPTCSGAIRRRGSPRSPRPVRTQAFSFAVFGDWGQVDANGNNPDQANLLAQLATSGARFAVTTRRQRLPVRQPDELRRPPADRCGDQRDLRPALLAGARAARSRCSSAAGNHGSERHGPRAAPTGNWPQDVAVASSGGTVLHDSTAVSTAPRRRTTRAPGTRSTPAPPRFYVLTPAWGDTQRRHRQRLRRTTTRRTWRPARPIPVAARGPAAHPSGLKFAFSHYPLYSDHKAQSSDTFLQGRKPRRAARAVRRRTSRSTGTRTSTSATSPSAPGHVPHVRHRRRWRHAPADRQPCCSRSTPMASGGRPRRARATQCGGAPVPTSATQVFHFLKVTVVGHDRHGRADRRARPHVRRADVRFVEPSPDTVIDSSPRGDVKLGTAATSPSTPRSRRDVHRAHSTAPPRALHEPRHVHRPRRRSALVRRRRDRRWHRPDARTAHVDRRRDARRRIPARRRGDARAPDRSASRGPHPTTSGVAGYDISATASSIGIGRGGRTTAYADTTAAPATAYQYRCVARDAPATRPPGVTAPRRRHPAAPPRSRTASSRATSPAWTSSGGLDVHARPCTAAALAAAGEHDERRDLREEDPARHLPRRLRTGLVRPPERGEPGQPAAHRTAADGSLGYVFVTAAGQLGLRNDIAATTTMSTTWSPRKRLARGRAALPHQRLCRASSRSGSTASEIDASPPRANLGTMRRGSRSARCRRPHLRRRLRRRGLRHLRVQR